MNTYTTYNETTDMNEQLTVVTRKGQVTIPAISVGHWVLKKGIKLPLCLRRTR